MRFRTIKYNVSESFHVVRWAIAIAVVAFCSVVSIYKFIELSGTVDITFSSLETTYLVLNDSINKVYIYLPLYVFVICGIVFDDNFGAVEILKAGSRKRWMTSKIMTLFLYTCVFFAMLFFLNFSICNRVFPYSEYWSTDFVNCMVLQGDSAINYTNTPMLSLGAYFSFHFLLYFFVGMVSVLVSLCSDKEHIALVVSLVVGIALSLYMKGRLMNQDFSAAVFYHFVTLGAILLIIVGLYLFVKRKNFYGAKKL